MQEFIKSIDRIYSTMNGGVHMSRLHGVINIACVESDQTLIRISIYIFRVPNGILFMYDIAYYLIFCFVNSIGHMDRIHMLIQSKHFLPYIHN